MEDPNANTLDRIYQLVQRLARPHTDNVWTGETIVAIDRLPLISDLRETIHSNSGAGRSGSANAHTRSIINLVVFEMYEDITGRIESFYNALTGKPPRKTAEETLEAWYTAYRAFSMSGKYTDSQERRVESQLNGFVARINAYFDPPRVKELSGECPMDVCGLSSVKAKDGSTQTALYATYKAGEQPLVKCRSCGTEWVGERALLEMGYYLKATVDVEALKEMGINA